MNVVPKKAFEIRQIAEEFLLKFGCEDNAPVDVDELAQYDLGIDIQSRAGLHADKGIEAAISHDLKTIFIENSLFGDEKRWRSAIAHEIAHVILHAEFIGGLPCDGDQKLVEAIVSIPGAEMDIVEKEAQIFAETILVPEASLKRIHGEQLELLAKMERRIDQLSDKSKESIAGKIADVFEVGTGTVIRRLQVLELEGWQPEPDATHLLKGFRHAEP